MRKEGAVAGGALQTFGVTSLEGLSDGVLTFVHLQSECHPDTCTQMTATEQWIFLCAAHKTPKEVRWGVWPQSAGVTVSDGFMCGCFSVPPSITPDTRWTELPAY